MKQLMIHRWQQSRKWGSYTLTKDLTGQTIVVTGANAGLGKDTAHALASRGATVVLACRNMQTGRQAAEEIRWEITL